MIIILSGGKMTAIAVPSSSFKHFVTGPLVWEATGGTLAQCGSATEAALAKDLCAL